MILTLVIDLIDQMIILGRPETLQSVDCCSGLILFGLLLARHGILNLQSTNGKSWQRHFIQCLRKDHNNGIIV